MYFYFKNKDKSMLYIAIGMAILSIAYLSRIRGELVFSDYYLALALSALFIVGVLYKPIQKLLSVK